MKFIVIIMDMDDIEIQYTLGPYDDVDKAEEDGRCMTQYLEEETLPGHARPHEWGHVVRPMMTYEQAVLAMIDPDKRK